MQSVHLRNGSADVSDHCRTASRVLTGFVPKGVGDGLEMPPYTCTPMSDGLCRLDGGAMYGMVPRVLWERATPPDDRNRIALGMTCWLLRDSERTVLLEAGMGDVSPKLRHIYALTENAPRLPDALAAAGVAQDEVDAVILSHLHLDHAGWCTRPDGRSGRAPTFPNADYIVHRGELEAARSPIELETGSYLPEHLLPVTDAGQWRCVKGHAEVLPGIRVIRTGGHTAHHQVVAVDTDRGPACFLGDLVPTHHHLRLAWVMAYDLYPVELVEQRKRILGRAADENWRLLWYHDSSLTESAVARADARSFCVPRE